MAEGAAQAQLQLGEHIAHVTCIRFYTKKVSSVGKEEQKNWNDESLVKAN